MQWSKEKEPQNVMVHKTQHRKLKIEQHNPYKKLFKSGQNL